MHQLLVRQLRRHFGSEESAPPELAPFLATVEEAYMRADEDRAILERSLDLSSRELLERASDAEATAIARDIGDRTRAQDGLRASQERLQLVMDGSADGLWDWDSAAGVVHYSARFKELLGVIDEEFPERMESVESRLHPEDRERVWNAVNAHFAGKGPFDEIARLRVGDDGWKWFQFRGQAIWDEHGAPTRLAGSIRDMSEIKAKEQELERARDEAEEASRAKNEFLANVSHEIRTPMNAVLGLTQLLLEGELRPRERDYANSMLEAGRSLLALINDLLDISRIEARELVIAPIEFSLATTVHETFRLFEPKARAKELAMSLVVDPDIPQRVVGDPGRLRQILMSLLGNAVKFTPQGGISLKVSVGDGDEVTFSVSDTGIGIAEDRLPHILETFTQVDAASTRRHGGTGLGLAISHHLATLMGGGVEATSEVGKGSRFTLRIPLRASPPVEESVSSTTAAMAGLRALVVNDDPDSQSRLRGDIESLGVQVEGAQTPASALTALRNAARADAPFDICVVNDRSSDLQSDALARVIKRDPMLERTVLVIVVTLGMPGDAKRLFDGGFTAYLAPPLHRDDIREAVEMAWRVERVEGARTLVTRHSLAERRMREAVVAAGAPAPPAELVTRVGTPSGAQAIPPESANAPRCLVVDDNDVNRHVAHQMLRRMGCRVVLASGGEEAVRLAGEESFDLILMDVQMPEVDGFAATARIRQLQRPENPRVPIIAVTANAMRGDRQRCLDAGMDDYLAKPITRAGLYEIVQHWTHRGAPSVPTPVASPAIDDAEVLDLAQLRSIVGSDKDRIREFVQMFVTLTAPLVGEFGDAVRAGDLERVRRSAHKLKGSCGSAGARQLAAVAQRAERAAHAAAIPELPALADELAHAFARIGALAGTMSPHSSSAA